MQNSELQSEQFQIVDFSITSVIYSIDISEHIQKTMGSRNQFDHYLKHLPILRFGAHGIYVLISSNIQYCINKQYPHAFPLQNASPWGLYKGIL